MNPLEIFSYDIWDLIVSYCDDNVIDGLKSVCTYFRKYVTIYDRIQSEITDKDVFDDEILRKLNTPTTVCLCCGSKVKPKYVYELWAGQCRIVMGGKGRPHIYACQQMSCHMYCKALIAKYTQQPTFLYNETKLYKFFFPLKAYLDDVEFIEKHVSDNPYQVLQLMHRKEKHAYLSFEGWYHFIPPRGGIHFCHSRQRYNPGHIFKSLMLISYHKCLYIPKGSLFPHKCPLLLHQKNILCGDVDVIPKNYLTIEEPVYINDK
jgi:hypothetical protein